MEVIANADSLTAAIKVAITELGDEKGHAPIGEVVDTVRANRPATAEDVHDCISSLQERGEVYPVDDSSKVAVTDRDTVVTDGGRNVTEAELRNRAAQARIARAEAALDRHDLDMAERCHKEAMSYRRRAEKIAGGKAVADGGRNLPIPSDWPYEAVTHGAEVSSTCRAITGDGNPCTNNAYRERYLCGLHEDTNDPEVLEEFHQWARIEDGDDVVTVCANCKTVWDGGSAPTAVDCPACPAEAGQRCVNEDSVYQENVKGSNGAPIPPHPKRRRVATEQLVNFELCPEAPGHTDEDQRPVTDGGVVESDDPSADDPSTRLGEVLKQYTLANREIGSDVGKQLNKLAIDAATIERVTDAEVETSVKRSGHATLFATFGQSVTPAEVTSRIAGITNADKTQTSRKSDGITVRCLYGERYREEIEAAEEVSEDG